MKKLIVLLFSISIFATNCHCKKKMSNTDEKQKEDNTMTDSKSDIKSMVVNPEYQWPGSTASFEIISQTISGDVLNMEVQYSGGCKTHVFTMNNNLHWMKSLPVQLNLYLEHQDNDDNCRELVTEKIMFDLKTCQYKPGNTAVLIINGNREQTLKYTY